MRKIYSFIVSSAFLLLISCAKEYTQAELQVLNGYWEIEKAKMPDGEQKDFSINSTIDYFEIGEDGVGFRQKVMPQINGEYLTNEVKEELVIKTESGKTWLVYKTKFAEWKEELVELADSTLVVKNESDIIYYYKKAVPFTLK